MQDNRADKKIDQNEYLSHWSKRKKNQERNQGINELQELIALCNTTDAKTERRGDEN